MSTRFEDFSDVKSVVRIGQMLYENDTNSQKHSRQESHNDQNLCFWVCFESYEDRSICAHVQAFTQHPAGRHWKWTMEKCGSGISGMNFNVIYFVSLLCVEAKKAA